MTSEEMDAYKESLKDWPPLPLKNYNVYDRSYPELVNEAFRAMNLVYSTGCTHENPERDGVHYNLKLWSSDLFTEQYNEALKVAKYIYPYWSKKGLTLSQVPEPENADKLTKNDFTILFEWFMEIIQLVNKS